MKAVRYHEFGDPSVLRYEDVERPSPASGEVLVRVAGTSFNGIDAGIRSGNMQGSFPVTLPHIPGIDVAGAVAELGAGVDGVEVGDEVVGFLPMVAPGASAEYAIAPAEILAPAPRSIPLADAAALPEVGLTAWQALFDLGQLSSGQRLLINGGSGAVGGYAIQLAKQAGAHVIATASPRTSERVEAAGADKVIDYTATDVIAALAEPVDILLNLAPVEPGQLAQLAAKVGNGGVAVNTTVWMDPPADEGRGVRGINLYVNSDARQLSELVARIDRGELRVDVAERVPLAELRSVHERAEAGELPGKVVVTVATS